MTDREARRRLHHKFIDLDNTPCLWCGSLGNREIDRITEGKYGGQYRMSNVRVLCLECHIKRHNKQKFVVRDKVVINGRCPKWLANELRHNRLRTITAVSYNPDKQCCYYSLGYNKLNDASYDVEAYLFRSYMLHHPVARGVGRPRLHRKLKCTVATLNQQQRQQNSQSISNYQLNSNGGYND